MGIDSKTILNNRRLHFVSKVGKLLVSIQRAARLPGAGGCCEPPAVNKSFRLEPRAHARRAVSLAGRTLLLLLLLYAEL